MRKCHVDESPEGRYGIILGGDLLTSLGLDINFYNQAIIDGYRLYEGCLAPRNNVNHYEFESLTDKVFNLKNPLSIHRLINDLSQKVQ